MWANGAEHRSVFHDAQQGIKHLEVTSTLPDEFQPIQNRLFAPQDGCEDTDYVFDIPVELFVALGGIRCDHDIPGAGPERWEILDRRR